MCFTIKWLVIYLVLTLNQHSRIITLQVRTLFWNFIATCFLLHAFCFLFFVSSFFCFAIWFFFVHFAFLFLAVLPLQFCPPFLWKVWESSVFSCLLFAFFYLLFVVFFKLVCFWYQILLFAVYCMCLLFACCFYGQLTFKWFF